MAPTLWAAKSRLKRQRSKPGLAKLAEAGLVVVVVVGGVVSEAAEAVAEVVEEDSQEVKTIGIAQGKNIL